MTPSIIPNPFDTPYQPDPRTTDVPPHIKWDQPRVLRSETTPYYDPGLDCTGDPGLADQSQAAETDVNLLMKKYIQTGALPAATAAGLYDDFSNPMDYQSSMDTLIHAQQQFDNLDAFVRQRFNNDPMQFLEFATNPKNTQELVKMGLATERPQDPIEALTDEIRTSNKKQKANPSPAAPKNDD